VTINKCQLLWGAAPPYPCYHYAWWYRLAARYRSAAW